MLEEKLVIDRQEASQDLENFVCLRGASIRLWRNKYGKVYYSIYAPHPPLGSELEESEWDPQFWAFSSVMIKFGEAKIKDDGGWDKLVKYFANYKRSYERTNKKGEKELKAKVHLIDFWYKNVDVEEENGEFTTYQQITRITFLENYEKDFLFGNHRNGKPTQLRKTEN
jgi:hypothetical protein